MDNKLQSYYQQAKPKTILANTIKLTNNINKENKSFKHKHDLNELLFGDDEPAPTEVSLSTPLTSRSDPFPLTPQPIYENTNLLLLDTFYDNLLKQHASEQAAVAASKRQKHQKSPNLPTSTSSSFHFNIDKLSVVDSITPSIVKAPEVVRCPTVIKGRTVVVPHNNNTNKMGNGSLAGCKLGQGTTGQTNKQQQQVYVTGGSNGFKTITTKVKPPYLTIRRSTEK